MSKQMRKALVPSGKLNHVTIPLPTLILLTFFLEQTHNVLESELKSQKQKTEEGDYGATQETCHVYSRVFLLSSATVINESCYNTRD